MIYSERFVLPVRIAVAAIIVAAAFVLLPQGSPVFAATFQPCQLPVVVGSTVRPNVMIVQDMSGSMQSAAYYDSNLSGSFGYYSYSDRAYPGLSISPLSGLTAYQMKTGYYGTADTDTFYKYNATGNTNGGYFEAVTGSSAPSQRVQFTSESKQGSTASQIVFTATGHGLAVGDWAAFYNLSSHLGMNGDACQVVAVDGDSFTVNAQWNGTPDNLAGEVVKRVIPGTSFATGVDGTVLNWLLTTRVDAAMKAFIGGRSVDSDASYYYLQYQGMRRFVVDETLGCLAHIRPGIKTNPDAWNKDSNSTYYGVVGSSSDPVKDMFMTVSNFWKGTLQSGNPNAKKYDNSGARAQVYKFTLTASATVTIRLFAADNSWAPRVNLYTGSSPTTTTLKANNTGSTAYPAEIYQQTLTAGNYCIEASSSAKNVYKAYYLTVTLDEGSGVTRGSDPNVALTKDTTDAYHNGTLFTSTVGSILNAQCRIQQPLAQRNGVVQNSFNQVRFGFMYFNSTSGNQGNILVGCDNTNLDTLLNAISGNGSQTYNSTVINFSGCYPYNGTPTGEAMRVAYNYFSQTTTYSSGLPTNSAFYAKRTTITDPYYGPDMDASGLPAPVICRKSYLLLVSDGEYNGTVEPCDPAQKLHVGDLRPETAMPNPKIVTNAGTKETPQNVTVYSIFTFSNSNAGINSMKAIAMFGAFNDVSSCGGSTMPYTTTAVPTDSTTFTWPRSDCNPSGTYNDTCCAEWDTVKERTGEVKDSQKGIPDTYYEASDGQQLERSLREVLQQVLARDASASAVATVSQQLATGDTVIRGVFEASDTQDTSKFLWYGHLEAYWGFPGKDDAGNPIVQYDFDFPCNSTKRCEDMPGASGKCTDPRLKHCWDGGVLLKGRDLVAHPRKVFTAIYDGTNKKWTNSANFQATSTPFPTATMLGVGTNAAATNLINWLLGNYVSGLRLRADKTTDPQNRLGDIVYSTPVIGGPPSPGAVSSNDPNILAFYKYRNKDDLTQCLGSAYTDRRCQSETDPNVQEVLYRDKVVYVGANDGMVHAFLLAKWDPDNHVWQDQVQGTNTDTQPDRVDSPHEIGQEIWAYMPSNLLKSVSALASTTYGKTGSGGCVHRPMIDLSEQVFEVFIHDPRDANYPTSGARTWRSVLVGGERGGGDTYFAIDVTDPYKPIVLWEYSVLKDRAILYSSKWYQPFSTAYDSICNFPSSWTQPALGRLQLPTSRFYVGAPDSTGAVVNVADYLQWPQPSSSDVDDLRRRHVVFMGGGLHLFDNAFTTNPDPPTGYTSTQWSAFKKDLFNPALLVIDIETGQNLFKYVWPTMVSTAGTTVFPAITNGSIAVPYAMSDPVAIDVWNPANGSPVDDGFTDRVYMGDTSGRFYGVKFSAHTDAKPGIQVDIWKTKQITDSTELASNVLRGDREPISQSPSISFENPQSGVTPNLRVIFAAGKYEDITGALDDKTDLHRTSLYNLQDPAATPTLPSSASSVLGTSFNYYVNQKCSGVSFLTGCDWVKSTGQPDCCQSSCSSPCFKCVFDLTQPLTSGPAERFTAKPLIAGGLVFTTSFMPSSSACDFTGFGFLYIFDYMCQPLPANFAPITQEDLQPYLTTLPVGGSSTQITGVQLSLGAGMPSRPVLDSAGKNVIVQMSDGTLKRIPVNLKMKPVQVQGWQEK